jgi:hypothetical protein
MSFSLVPDTGPPRILRFVQSAQMPSDSTLFMLDRSTNVLMINNHLYDQLDVAAQHRIVRTQLPTHEVTRAYA